MDGSYSANKKKVVSGPSNLVAYSSLDDSAQRIGLEKLAKAVKKNHFKAIRDFTRAQLMFLEEKRKHSLADMKLAERCCEKSKDLMLLYQREKSVITEALKPDLINQELLDSYIKDTKRIQDKTERLQYRAKQLLQKRKGASFRSPTLFESSQTAKADFSSKNFTGDKNKLNESQEVKAPQIKHLTNAFMQPKKAIGTINSGIEQRMKKISHIPLDNRRRLIARCFYENEHTWLEIEKSDSFLLSKIILG